MSVAVYRQLPKVDLHLHLEGSISLALLRRLASRRGDPVPLPSDFAFHDFAGFLQAFGRVCGSLRAADDFRLAVCDLGRKLRRDGVIHAEVFVSPQVHSRSNISWPALAAALEDGAGKVAAAGGPSLLFIADGVRQWGAASFGSMVRDLASRPSPVLAAVGLGGLEGAIADGKYRRAFAAARDLGLAAVVHAGETGPPAAVRDAVNLLGARRIGHGLAAAQDEPLCRDLAAKGIVLDICPTSNRRTGALPAGSTHPLPALLRAGVPVTLGSDDPALFRTSLSGEYTRAAAMGLNPIQLARVAGTAARASLLPDRQRRALVQTVTAAWGAWARGTRRQKRA